MTFGTKSAIDPLMELGEGERAATGSRNAGPEPRQQGQDLPMLHVIGEPVRAPEEPGGEAMKPDHP